MSKFTLHPQIQADTIAVVALELCDVRLHNDANYPWLILIPRRADLREIHRLSEDDQRLLMREISHVSSQLEAYCDAEKMNIATLGNMVPQLHIHVIARFGEDPAWPGPIWGAVPSIEYLPSRQESFCNDLARCLS